MNAAPIKRTLSVTGLLLIGAAGGIGGTKLLAPHVPAITECKLAPLPAAWPQGQPHQAELALDQALWMRPLPELAGYRTPIRGLWLCGQAMHPAVPGIAGYNCARAILRGE